LFGLVIVFGGVYRDSRDVTWWWWWWWKKVVFGEERWVEDGC
jgi:hypothetical protein